MAVEVIRYQAVHFPEAGKDFNTISKDCVQGDDFCQLVKPNQTSQFVARVTESDGNEIVQNEEFITDLSHWGTSGFIWTNAGNGSAQAVATGATIEQVINFSANVTYKITIEWSKIGDDPFQLDVLKGAQFLMIGGQSSFDETDTPGFYTFYFRPTFPFVNLFVKYNSSTTVPVFIHSLSVFQLTEPIVELRDSSDNVISTLTTDDRYKDLITYSNQWTQSDGTYKFCITNGEDLALNYLGCSMALNWSSGAPLLITPDSCLLWI